MPLWIPLTVAAAFLQNLRSSLQKHLTAELGTQGATYVRFLYGLPVAGVVLLVLTGASGLPLPAPNARFLLFCAAGGLAQIAGTVLLLALFRLRNFAVGTTYAKTETVQAALVGTLVLGELPSLGAALGIVVSLAGVLAISAAQTRVGARGLLASLGERPALLGLASGAAFGLAAVCYRAAALSLGAPGFLAPATFTLVAVLAIQTAAMTAWLALRAPALLRGALRQWRVAAWTGVAGGLASVGWFSAMTLQNAAYVRAVGQVELLFAFASSALLFRERTSLGELLGVALVVAGILLLVAFP